jgi:polyvinyl alcohol dehydrogenase (cytochrome)
MALARRWAVVALALMGSACGQAGPEHDPDAPKPPPTAAGLYRDNCASCHDGANPPASPARIFRQMRPEAVVAAMDGVMSQQAAGLSPSQRIALAEFVTGSKLGTAAAAPAPLLCEAWQNRIDVNRTQQAPALLTAAGLPRMGVKWAFAIPGATRVRAPLAVAGGAVFTGSEDGMVYAIDEGGGCLRWRFKADAEVRSGIAVSPWQPGDMAAQPSIYFGDMAGNAYRVDAATGQLVWKVRADEHVHAVIADTPVLHEGKLYVPVASTEQIAAADPDYECCYARGGVMALDAATGGRVWKATTIQLEPRLTGGTNAAGTPVWQPAGAAVWGSPVLDAKRKRLYVASGSASTSPASKYSDAVIALDLETGRPAWRYQATPRDAWTWACIGRDRTNCPAESGPDNGFIAPPVLVALPDNKDILIAAQKSGDVHALDPETGKPVWRGRLSLSGRMEHAMAVDGTTVYAATSGGMAAFDAATGQSLWTSPAVSACPPDAKPGCGAEISTPPATLPGAVIAGSHDGRLRAYDAATGQVIWSFDTSAPAATPNGGTAQGGSMEGGRPVIAYGRIFLGSGSLLGGHMAGNAIIVLEPGRGAPAPGGAPAPEPTPE